MMCITPHWLKCLHARVTPFSCYPWWAVDCFLVASLFLSLFLSVCLSSTLLFSSHFFLYSVLNLFFRVDNAKANITCASANRGVLLSGRIHSCHTRSTRPLLLCGVDGQTVRKTVGDAAVAVFFEHGGGRPFDLAATFPELGTFGALDDSQLWVVEVWGCRWRWEFLPGVRLPSFVCIICG